MGDLERKAWFVLRYVCFARYEDVPAPRELEAKVIILAENTLMAEIFKAGEVAELVDGGPNYNAASVTEANPVRGLHSETILILPHGSVPYMRFAPKMALSAHFPIWWFQGKNQGSGGKSTSHLDYFGGMVTL